jgi:hypothetical protein
MNTRPSSWLQPVKNSSNLSTLSVSRQPLPGYDQPSTSGANLAPNIEPPPTPSDVQWLDADDVSVVRPHTSNTATGGDSYADSAAYGTPSGGYETGVSLPAEQAAIGDNSLDGGGAYQLISSKSAAPGNVAAAGPLAIQHVDSGGKGADEGPSGGGGVYTALAQVEGFDAEERGAVDHAGQLEESILLHIFLYHGYDFRKPIIWCSVSLFAEEKKLVDLCAVSFSKGI